MSVKYAKFDSFLKRILPHKEYKEVRTYEPCVVTSSRDKHAFRFTFVTNDRIYVTENPPKTLLYHVHLKDVIDVYMINDKANFLQAELRERVQHVIVKHVTVKEDDSPAKIAVTRNQTSYSPQRSFPATFPGTVENGAPSSSMVASPPILCSYAEVGTIENTQPAPKSSTGNDERDGEDPASPRLWSVLTSAKTWKYKSKMKKPESGIRWQQKDPHPIQVMLPESEDGSPINTEELHLYILDENTTFLLLLKSLWRNYIIYRGSSQRLIPGQSNIANSTLYPYDMGRTTPEKSASMDGNTRTLFADLKQELLYVKNVEQLYGLYNELKTAAAQDILIKSLFWRDDMLLKRSLELISRYIKDSVSVDMDVRADEIELTIIVLQALALMLRETEAIPQCYRVLQNLSLPVFNNVINSLLCSPRLLCESWSYHDDIKALMIEVTVAVCEVLHQLIICAHQITWVVNGKSPVFCSSSLFSAIDTNVHLHTFLKRLIGACINRWDPPAKKPTKLSHRLPAVRVTAFSPEEAVKAYHLFTVFHRLITKSSNAALHVKTSYQEEFKYYINPGSVPIKFPSKYPISGMARSAVHAVGFYITGMTAHAK